MAKIESAIPLEQLQAGIVTTWYGAGRETTPAEPTTPERFVSDAEWAALFPPGDPLDGLLEEDTARCEECGAPPDAYCTRGCAAQETTRRPW